MANTVLKLGPQSVRINYHDLADVLSILNRQLGEASLLRKVTEPWLNHIRDDLGYVLLNTEVLNNKKVLAELDLALTSLSSDLRSARVAPDTPRWKNVTGDTQQSSAYLNRLQVVIRELRSITR